MLDLVISSCNYHNIVIIVSNKWLLLTKIKIQYRPFSLIPFNSLFSLSTRMISNIVFVYKCNISCRLFLLETILALKLTHFVNVEQWKWLLWWFKSLLILEVAFILYRHFVLAIISTTSFSINIWNKKWSPKKFINDCAKSVNYRLPFC